jgi:hypothetical protein
MPFCTALATASSTTKSKELQLRQLALARESQGDHEEAVDQDRPNELLDRRHIELDDVVPYASTLTRLVRRRR